MQAVRWIKAREGRALEGKVKTFGDTDFLKQLELAVTYGGAFLFEGCDEYIDPVIDPVLEKALTPGPGGKQVRAGHVSGLLAGGATGRPAPPPHPRPPARCKEGSFASADPGALRPEGRAGGLAGSSP
jgi:hypothetical protein